ncbi:MAG TPA: pentapeptide repeat-containing protein, partial [Chloroflexia bacterium]|nr:pentapeptide repeat-containing protein [Chloroflexia bacterium]
MNFNSNGSSDRQNQERPVLNRADVERLLAREGGSGHLRLSGYSFNRADLSRLDLSGADLSESDLTAVNLSEANLTGANLSGANLFIANMRRAILRRANLAGAKLNPAELGEADLSKANLSGTDLSSADLSTTRLEGANFSGADLTDAYLTTRQKDALLQSGISFRGSNAIRLVFLPEDELPSPGSGPSPTAATQSQAAKVISCRVNPPVLTALNLSRLLTVAHRLYILFTLLEQGDYTRLVKFSRAGLDASPEEFALEVTDFERDEKGLALGFRPNSGPAEVAEALETALSSQGKNA